MTGRELFALYTGNKVSTFKDRFSILVSESQKTNIELAKDLHMSNQTISAWCNGTRSPKEPTIIVLARYFEVSVQWLMGFDVPREPERRYSEDVFDLDLQQFSQNAPSSAAPPQTSEARILARGIDKLPKSQREQALAVVKAMFAKYADYFEEDKTDDA